MTFIEPHVWEDGTGELCVSSGLGIIATTLPSAVSKFGQRRVTYTLTFHYEGGMTVEWPSISFADQVKLTKAQPAILHYLAAQYGPGTVILSPDHRPELPTYEETIT